MQKFLILQYVTPYPCYIVHNSDELENIRYITIIDLHKNYVVQNDRYVFEYNLKKLKIYSVTYGMAQVIGSIEKTEMSYSWFCLILVNPFS